MHKSPVVVAADGSPAALAAVDWAADEAGRTCRWRWSTRRCGRASRRRSGPTRTRPSRIEQALAESCVRTVGDCARIRQPGVRVATTVLPCDPEPALVHAGDRASLLVVGSRSLAPATKVLLGSVSLPVVVRARCPGTRAKRPW